MSISPPMFHIVYVSSTVNILDYDQQIDLLNISLKNNALRNVTGCLIYAHGNYIQVLEGKESDVEFTFSKILKDKRHHQITVIERANIKSRDFESWYMGFRYYEAQELLFVDGHSIIPSIIEIAKEGIALKLLLGALENHEQLIKK